MRLPFTALPFALALLSTPLVAQGRGDYLNFEAPQVKPIQVAVVAGHPFLLVCNTPDNSVEVYDIDLIESQPLAQPVAQNHGLVARIPVGPEPVSVLFHDFSGQTLPTGPNLPTSPYIMYTANWLGDSVSIVQLRAPGGVFEHSIVRTVDLRGDDARAQTRPSDEPMALAIIDVPLAGSNPPLRRRDLLVTKRSGSSISVLDAFSGNPKGMDGFSGGGADVILTSAGRTPWGGTLPTAAGTMALKEPHTILVAPGTNRVWVLGHQGGDADEDGEAPDPSDDFDFDVWATDLSLTQSSATVVVDGLGTTNFNMALASQFLFVVGTQALAEVEGNQALAALDTGFVKTVLHKIPATNPSLVMTRDLNETAGGAVNPDTQGLAHATDVAVYRGQIVALTAFNSDRFALVDTTGITPLNWQIGRADIPAVSGDPADVAGPRGLVVRLGATSALDRIYVLNRLENSVTVVRPDPDGNQATLDPTVVDEFLLDRDPVPDFVRDGQKFLYSTRFSRTVDAAGDPTSSERGFVSCASCHVDGRSDQLAWKLTAEEGIPLQYPPEVSGETWEDFCDLLSFGFDAVPDGKGPKITQSLQGLLNNDAAGDDLGDGNATPYRRAFDLVTNAPYHWRADKTDFTRFNEAFHGLQGMDNLGTAEDPQGLTDPEMEAFETFINSVHYPPNPLQHPSRVYRDTDPDIDEEDGALLGLKLFHQAETPEPFGAANGNSFGKRSCVQCHSLPEGSNNRVVSLLNFELMNGAQPLEAAALRGLRQKERRLELTSNVLIAQGAAGGTASTSLITGDFGMGNEGFSGDSLNGFLQIICKNQNEQTLLTDINAYLREFDTGVAPVVGRSITVFQGAVPTTELEFLEAQAGLANCGISVYMRDNGIERGFWYSVREVGSAPYIENGGTAAFERSELISALHAGDVLVFTATPLGSERRMASLDATPDVPASPANPTATLAGTAPNSANAPIRSFEERPTPNVTLSGPSDPCSSGFVLNPPRSLRTLDILVENLEAWAYPEDAPLEDIVHDAPRRLRVQGTGLVEGCVLKLGIWTGSTAPIWTSASDPLFKNIELPLFPVDSAEIEGLWETAVEFDPMTLYTLLLGGPYAPGVSEAFDGIDSGTFSRGLWDWYRVEVINPSGGGVTGSSTTPEVQPLLY